MNPIKTLAGIILGASVALGGCTDTFKESEKKGDWSSFQYQGETPSNVEERLQVSNLFDEWDESRGDYCKNTGWKNVQSKGDQTHIYVKCKDGENDQPNVQYAKIDYSNKKLQQKIKAGKFETGFLDDVEQMCKTLDMNAMGLLSVMDFETVGIYSPKIKNPRGSATGLIQFTSGTARGLGTSTSKLRKMGQREQLEYVEKYFKGHTKHTDYSDPSDIALAVFYPRALKHDDDYVIGKLGSLLYRQNRGLDKSPKDGRITAAEYVKPALDRGYF